MGSCVVTGHLVRALWVRKEFKIRDHTLLLREGCSEIRNRNVQNSHAALEEAMESSPDLEAHRLRRGTKTGT